MQRIDEFCSLIHEYIATFEQLTDAEQEKLNAVQKNHVTFIEKNIHREQALLLKFRGLESKREKFLTEEGFSGFTFREILDKVPENQASVLLPLFDSLNQKVRLFRAIEQSSKDAIQLQLHNIETLMKTNEIQEKETHSSSSSFKTRFV